VAVEKTKTSTTFTGRHIDLVRMVSIQKALKLEMAGLKGRGSLIKVCKAMGFKGGTKKKAYEWITKHIEEFKEADKYEVN
tara:strand:+ start:5244 stop:5483 length:240 start_codon:yes stop_codon:yes gene_type:complete